MGQRSKLAKIFIVAVFVIAAGVTAGLAQSRRGARTVAPAHPAASTAGLKPTGPARRKVVGTCNTLKGCAVLKDACVTLPGHTFKSTGPDGSGGLCIAGSQKGQGASSADVDLSTPENVAEATLYCNGVSLCRKVQNFCALVGGRYTPTSGHTGHCEY